MLRLAVGPRCVFYMLCDGRYSMVTAVSQRNGQRIVGETSGDMSSMMLSLLFSAARENITI